MNIFRYTLYLSLIVLFQLHSTRICSQVVINEYSCSNLSQFDDDYGKYEDWIEIYNKGNLSINLSGFHLSDDSLNNLKYTLPPGTSISGHGFLRFWASGRNVYNGSHYHTNFKLTQTKNNKEYVVLSDPSGSIIDYIKISQETQLGHSIGRSQDGLNLWSIFTNPSPNTSNNSAVPYLDYADRPDFDLQPGFYPSQQVLSISTNEPNADIHYTLDGSAPTANSPIYINPLSIYVTTVVKAITISANPEILPSFLRFATYFINENHSLVVVSVAGTQLTELANGIGSLVPIGSFEYFDIDHVLKSKTYGEFNRHGQDSWANSQRSIDFISRDEMGYNHSIEEKIFNLSDRQNFQRIILRAAGDDNYPADHHAANEGSAHLRDAYVHSTSKQGGLDLDVRLSEKAIIYLNGAYWGVYDLRENPDEHDYTDYYYGQDKYHLQYILTWGSTWAEYGGAQALADWDNLYNYIMTNPMSNPLHFKYVSDRYDWASLVDYIIVNSFSVCSDWLVWNTGWWRGMDSTGTHLKWGYILWDNDATYGHYINYTGIPDTTANALPCNPEGLTGGSDPKGHIKVLNRLRQNPEFNQYYITRQIDLWNRVYSCDNMSWKFDSTAAIIDPEMSRHAQRWNGTYTEWQNNVQKLRNYIMNRCMFLPTGFMNCYSLTGPHFLTIMTDPPAAGRVKLNSVLINQYPWDCVQFSGIDQRLEAFADSGWIFDHWSSANQNFLPNSAADTAFCNLTGPDTIVAHFSIFASNNNPEPEIITPRVTIYPTLFRDQATLTFDLPSNSAVSLGVYDVLGNQIEQLLSRETFTAGTHALSIDWSSKKLSQGIYIVDFRAGSYRKCMKLIHSR